MARDRQRAKQRRGARKAAARLRAARPAPARLATSASTTRPSTTPAWASRTPASEPPDSHVRDVASPLDGTPTPDPLEHASADVDQAKLAEAGRRPARDRRRRQRVRRRLRRLRRRSTARPTRPRTTLVVSADPDAHERPARKQRGRVLTFLRHCVDELRRVQWPNRRQVGQATAVVLGFVVLAGGYLGLLDALWKPIIDAIL